jgi:glutathione S-transferase
MKLYYSPGACSLSPHIALHEAGLDFAAIAAPTKTHKLAERPYLMGQQFTVADAYLFTVVGWSRLVRLDISALPRLGEFMARMRARPAVQAALRAEGLLN